MRFNPLTVVFVCLVISGFLAAYFAQLIVVGP